VVTFEAIEAARQRIAAHVYLSPCAHSQTFSRWCGNKLYFKLENLQMAGSFKERGALNKILLSEALARKHGVVAASAGNHAQGVAYHGVRLGIDTCIVMPEGTPVIKVRNTREFGARVVLHGEDFDEAFAYAQRLVAEEGRLFVHPFDDPDIIAGQGTIGLELLEQNPYLDCVVVPVGGGGLISGLAAAIKETNPRIRVVGVEAAAVPSMRASLDAGHPVLVPPARTMADGIAVREVGALTFAMVQRYVDDVVTVSEDAIANAVLRLLETEKTVAEGAAAATAAAALAGLTGVKGKKVCCVISGGNIDVNILSRIIERGLVADGRIARIDVAVPDRPGSLARLTAVVAARRGNILQIEHDRARPGLDVGDTMVELLLETRGPEHRGELIDAIRAEGFAVLERALRGHD
jgi:threonine dehydratase